MTRYSAQPKDRIIIKSYGFLFFAKKIRKDLNKNLNDKYSYKRLDHAKQALKTTSKRAIRKGPEGTGDLIGNKITGKII